MIRVIPRQDSWAHEKPDHDNRLATATRAGGVQVCSAHNKAESAPANTRGDQVTRRGAREFRIRSVRAPPCCRSG
eukprot:1277719-Rhodomonas_salina.1